MKKNITVIPAVPEATENINPALAIESKIDLSPGRAAVVLFQPRAMALPKTSIQPLRGSADVILHNVTVGMDSLAKVQSQLIRLPDFDVAMIESTRTLGFAFAWTAHEVGTGSEEPSRTQELLKTAKHLRGVMLGSLDVMVRLGEIPAEPIAAIHKGRGPRDTARDCIDCSAQFRQHWARLSSKTPVTMSIVEQGEQVGKELLTVLRPKGSATTTRSAEDLGKIDLRDRFYTLLVHDHTIIRQAAGWVFGDERDAKVPPLLAASWGRKSLETKAKNEAALLEQLQSDRDAALKAKQDLEATIAAKEAAIAEQTAKVEAANAAVKAKKSKKGSSESK
jgi:hypothetical protein